MKEADDIVNVWADNLHEEFNKISMLIEKYPYVGMDTEFPGFFVKSPPLNASEDIKYQVERENVNRMKLIQIGITLGDEEGKVPTPVCTWQFNFRFDISHDLQVADSIQLLKKAGIDFEKFNRDGIEVADFANLFFASGLLMNENVIWVTFQAGYDIAYLVKLVSAQPIPKTDAEFEEVVRIYFPHYYDVRFIMQSVLPVVGSLETLAREMGVVRSGSMHQAGSDSYVTLLTFYEVMKKHFNGKLINLRFRNRGCR